MTSYKFVGSPDYYKEFEILESTANLHDLGVRGSVSGPLTRRATLSVSQVHMGFVVNEVAQTQISLQVL
jgi:hypothetical protein